MKNIRLTLGLLCCPLFAPTLSVAMQPPAAVVSRESKRVFVADSFWTVKWTRGYDKEEALFIEPRSVAISGGSVIVLDQGTREVHLFDRLTGATQSSLVAKTGSGPGEFRRPVAVVPAPTGFGVLDEANARLTVFDFNQRRLWDTQIPDAISRSLCIQSDGTITWKRSGTRNAIEVRDTAGKKLRTASLPWKQNDEASLSTGVQVGGPSATGECAMVREFGPGFAIVSRTGAVRAYPFVEEVEEPLVKSTSKVLERSATGYTKVTQNKTSAGQSGMNAMVLGDTLIIRFGGATKPRIRLLDYYSLTTGKYLHSRKLPSYVVSVAVGPDGTFYAAEIGEEYSGVVALKPSKGKAKKAAMK